jgi:fumarylacetoacetase
MPINDTHDPNLRSWVESANDPATDFPIQNLPFATRQRPDGSRDVLNSVVVAIGDSVLDLSALAESGLVTNADRVGLWFWLTIVRDSGRWPTLRREIQSLLAEGNPRLRDHPDRDTILMPRESVELATPWDIPNYTDFYASIHHASTVGSMFRPDHPLLPNYKHVPIGYHGRASSIVASGAEIRRPRGQQAPPEGDPAAGPSFGPSKMLDYELEVGMVVGPGNALGEPIDLARAEEHLFGLCLVNDWSARDLQKWEYQPLGPFLAKNFATSVSPFIVTLEALEPFRCPASRRPAGDPRPLPYLFSEENEARGGFDITLEVLLESAEMRTRGMPPLLISRSHAFKEMYWTMAQLLTHHASNGCNLQPGDLLASGTVSGLGPAERGCMLELTWQGNGPDGKPLPRKPIELPTGETRTFLADGDEVVMRGYCEREGFRRVGFGECRGRVLPAPA